jgi:hypothetical protein
MIDNRTENKNYPLPHPENIASQDVGRIATAIEAIDADVFACSDAIDEIQETVQELDAKSLRIPESLVGIVDTELHDLQPRQYIVVNNDATGFTTVEGGGGEGGLMGEVLAKRTNFNFDTIWVDPRAISKKAAVVNEVDTDCQLKNNNVVILTDEIEIDNSDQLPRVGLTQRQTIDGVIADSQYAYMLCDEIDESTPDESDIATREKFGRVKIGSGIDIINGKISHAPPPLASKTAYGLVKIGPGLDVAYGVASAQSYRQADHENYGTVKLSSDFKTGNSGELLLADKKDIEEIIYQAANVDIAQNNCIILKSNFKKYRLFIHEDSLITFDWSQIVVEKDLAFELEIVAGANYVISFDAHVIWTLPCAGVSAGKTAIHFERKFGSTALYGELKNAETKLILNLTPNAAEDVQPDFICGHNGLGWNASACLSVKDYSNYASFANPTDGIWYVDFMRSTYVEYLEYAQGYDNWTADYFYIEGSIDKKNWKRLLTRENVKPETYTLDAHGFFRHYRIRCRHAQIRYFRWFGYGVEDELFELKKVVPIMTANSLNGFSLTSTGTNEGALYNLTQNSISNWANFSARSNGEFWIKYELPEAAVMNLIDLAAPNGSSDRMSTWFKIEASNDDENWTLLLERASITRWYDGETRQYHIANNAAYKFYKFTPIEIPTAEFRIARFRLYQKIAGQETMKKFIPILTSSTQGGYEISCSSQLGDHPAYCAFDGNDGTQWGTTAGSAQNGWIQVKFPTETLCNAVSLKARIDQYYAQAAASFEIQGSNDGQAYAILKTVNTSWTQGEEKVIEFFAETPYLYYRIFIKTVQDNGSYAAFSTINFGTILREYKRDLNVKENLLPIMNANSQDGYAVSCNSEYDGSWPICKAFDRNAGTSWSTKYDSPTTTILITLPTAKVCNFVSVYPRSGQLHQAFGAFTLHGSSDGDNWTELLSVTEITAWSNNIAKEWIVENDLAFLRYKIVATPFNQENCVSAANIDLFHKYTIQEY